MSRKNWTFVLAVAVVLSGNWAVFAQGPSADDLKARIDRLEQQNQALLEYLQRTQSAPSSMPAPPQNGATTNAPGGAAAPDQTDVKKIVGDVLNEREKKKKDDEAAAKKKADDEGYKVGTDLKMSVNWANGLKFTTPNRDFDIHLGTRLQYDMVWFDQSPNIVKQVGDFEDGFFFRRVRIQADGTFHEVFEFNTEIALENSQRGIVSLDEFWAGIKDVPFFGCLRVGNQKVTQGLEGDMVSSSKAMTFMERAAFTDAFYQNFATGIWQENAIWDQRATYSSMFFRQNIVSTGDSFGDGEYGVSGRITGLPYYENDGRCLMHLGLSGVWRHAQRPANETADPQFVRFRARPELRDASGDIDGAAHDGSAALNPGNSSRLVDTGNIQADAATICGSEFLWIAGPLSVQAEYALAFIDAATIAKVNRGNVGFDGGYAQISYFLTGENRQYDKRFGRLATNAIASPNTPFWFVRDENGGFNSGLGAWEIAARFSHLNLNGGDNGLIRGGVMDGVTLGLNWYLNNNFKIQFDYIHDNRYHLAPGVVPGNVDGLGIRTQFFF